MITPCRRRETTFCQMMKNAGLDVVSGKIASIYDSIGVTADLSAKNNEQTIDQTINALNSDSRGLIFSNLVDFDMLYGHRRDTEGYAKALEHLDSQMPAIIDALRDDDLLIMTADHGNDPSMPGSDHTREYVPLLVFGKNAKSGIDLGTRQSLSDIGGTIARIRTSPLRRRELSQRCIDIICRFPRTNHPF